MSRIQQQPPKLKKGGAFSRYSMDGIVTIEGILTSFDMKELRLLSYARDLQSQDWDFDLLIQRDLDKTRAHDEIGTYLLPETKEDKEDKEDKIVFLPPLIAAIVVTNEQEKLEDYYPKRIDSEISDTSNDKIYLRAWGTTLEVRNYLPVEGSGITIEHDSATPHVDTSQAEIVMNYPNQGSGIKLVVIDGQHRLYALQNRYLDLANRKRMKNLLIPVMLVYPPNATKDNNPHTRKIPSIFRQLFVDVNKNAMSVSGHFIILLSNKTLGSMICQSFCQTISDEATGNNLAMVEWNTRLDKESKTISKDYSITSIGVLHETLESIFKKDDNIALLRHIMGIHDIPKDKFYGNKPLPTLFPWQNLESKHKLILRKCVDKTFTPCLLEIFFGSKCYGKIKTIFDHTINEISTTYDGDSAINSLQNHLKYGENPHVETAKTIEEEFIKKFKAKYNAEELFIGIIRRKVFQKGMIFAWIKMLNIAKEHQLGALETTKGFVKLLDHAIDTKLFVNDNKHEYLQDSVFKDKNIIKYDSSSMQISRLILACWDHLEKNSLLEFNQAQKDDFAKLGKNAFLEFMKQLKDDKIKLFKRNYRTDVTVNEVLRKKLEVLEAREDLKAFNNEVEKKIKVKYNAAFKKLSKILETE